MGVIRVIEGKLRLRFADAGDEQVLTPDQPGLVRPEQVHRVEPMGRMRMQVDFYDKPARSRCKQLTDSDVII